MINYDWEKTDARRRHTMAPNKNQGHMRRKGFRSPQSDKRDGGIFAKLRMCPSGEWVSSSNNTRWMLADVHLEQGVPGLTRWHATRVGLSVRDKTVANDPNAIITKGGKSLDRVGNPVIQLQRFVEVVRDSQLAQRNNSLDVSHTSTLASMASDGTVRREPPMNSQVSTLYLFYSETMSSSLLSLWILWDFPSARLSSLAQLLFILVPPSPSRYAWLLLSASWNSQITRSEPCFSAHETLFPSPFRALSSLGHLHGPLKPSFSQPQNF
jgi:hypothetical protein